MKSDVATDNHLVFGGRSIFMTRNGRIELKEAGEYIIRAKVEWRHGHEDTCTISAYSSAVVSFEKIAAIKDFQSKYCTLLALQNQEEKYLIGNSVSVVDCYGKYVYALIKNKDDKELKVGIEFTKLDNIRLSKFGRQSDTTFALTIPAGENQLIFLKIINPTLPCAYDWSWQSSF